MSTRTDELIYVHAVNRGLDRAFAAAEEAQARHDGAYVEVWLEEHDAETAGLDNTPAVCFLVGMDDEPEAEEPFKASLACTAGTMSRRIEDAIAKIRQTAAPRGGQRP
jgi:hypothetical protein